MSEIVIREVLPVPGGATLLALGMLRDLTAGRIDVWDLGKDKRETMKDTKKECHAGMGRCRDYGR